MWRCFGTAEPRTGEDRADIFYNRFFNVAKFELKAIF
jgi:hypothetical protein